MRLFNKIMQESIQAVTTRAQIIQNVAEDLGLIPIGQAAEAQDVIRIGAAFDRCYAILESKGLATWASANDVPDKISQAFESMIAERLLVSYSVPESRFARIKATAGDSGMLAVATLAKAAIARYVTTTEPTDY